MKNTYRKIKYLNGAYVFSLLLLLLVCFALIFAGPAAGAEKPKTDKTQETPAKTDTAPATPQPAQPAKPAAPAVHPITQNAVKSGVLSCAGLINKVMMFLTANSKSTGAFLFFSKSRPDQSIFSASLELQNQESQPVYASASFTPLANGRTSAVYDSVRYVPKSCEYVEKNTFKNLKRVGLLKKDIIMLDGGAVSIFLMPAGTGCIIIQKEIVE